MPNRFDAFATATVLMCSLALAAPALGQGPVIERIVPTSGTPGVEVQIVGRNLQSAGSLRIGDVELEVIDRTPMRWTVRVPEGAVSGHIVAQGSTGSFRGPYFRIMDLGAAPVIESLSPRTAVPGGQVTLEGSGFASSMRDNRVTLNGRSVVVLRAAPNRLVVTVPVGATSGSFQVSVRGGASSESPQLSVGTSLSVTGISAIDGVPLLAPTFALGEEFRLLGTGFVQGSTVTFRRAVLDSTWVSSSEMRVIAPDRVGSGTLIVSVDGLGRAESQRVKFAAPPALDSFSPGSAPPGARIRIMGNHFGRDIRQVRVTIGSAQLRVRRVSPTSIDAELPPLFDTGALSVSVGRLNVTSGQVFTSLASLSVAEMEPDNGPVGSRLTLRGRGFSANPVDNTVEFAGRLAEVLTATPTELVVSVPEGAGTGPVSVAVANNGSVRSNTAFTVTVPPIISDFRPRVGDVGEPITIHGRGFGIVPGLVLVKIGGQRAQVTGLTNEEITVTAPPGPGGPIQVTVRLQGTDISEHSFFVAAPLRVSEFSPSTAHEGQLLTIFGTGFLPATRVKFEGAPPTAALTVHPGSLTVEVPVGSRSGAIGVVLPDQRMELPREFVLRPMPEGVAVSRVSGDCEAVGCIRVLEGHGFAANPGRNRVTFGGRRVRVVRATPSRLTVEVPQVSGTHSFRVRVRWRGDATSPPVTIRH